MPLTLEDLKLIVDRNEFEKLVGEVENEFFDAKSQPYQFDAGDYAKRDLAKDVTAFANAGGGYIFIGLQTELGTTHFGEEVKALCPVARELINSERYHKIISEWVYPEPKGVLVEWLPHGIEGKGIGVVYVPPSEHRMKPYLITKTEVGTKITHTLVGYAERRRDSTNTFSVVELQQALRVGINFSQEVLGRLDSVESILESFFRTSAGSEAAGKRAEELASRIEFALQHDEIKYPSGHPMPPRRFEREHYG